MSEAIKLEGVSKDQIDLVNDGVLVRVVPREEVRASGLHLLHGSKAHQIGSEFYGEVVKVGPGALVREGPSPEEVADFVRCAVSAFEEIPAEIAHRIQDAVRGFLERHRPLRRIAPPWKPGDQVLVKQGFGVEIDLREGRHHLVERAGQFGHGIVAKWDDTHRHCWHLDGMDPTSSARCACGAVHQDLDTRLPACANCPPGERLAEAVLGGKDVYSVKIPDVPKPVEFDPERPGGFSVGEMRPE